MIHFLGKISLGCKSACKTGKYLLVKLLICGKIWLYDVTNLTESILKTSDIWETFWNYLATNGGE